MKRPKKLMLKRETVRNLTPAELEGIRRRRHSTLHNDAVLLPGLF